jgi:hypothetical protein
MKWYKRDCKDALEGMRTLTLEEAGAYNKVIDLIYLKDNRLEDDDRFMTYWLNCDLRVWKRLKQRLVDLGKLAIKDGCIVNGRAQLEIEEALAKALVNAELSRSKGIKSAMVRRKNKHLGEPQLEPNGNRYIDSKKERKEDTPLPPSPTLVAGTEVEQACIRSFNGLAQDIGLPEIKYLSLARQQKLAALLPIIGGQAGFYDLMDRVRQSRYLRGDGNEWRATFDWLLNPDNAAKVLEGNFDDRRQHRSTSQVSASVIDDLTRGVFERNANPEETRTDDTSDVADSDEGPPRRFSARRF